MSRPQAKYWAFTENNPEGELQLLLQDEYDNGNLQWAVWQLEVGENGTEHFQGTLCFNKKKLLTTVKKLLPRAHLSVCRSVQDSINYCMKPDGMKDSSFRLDGPWTIGTPKYTEDNSKAWNRIRDAIKEGADDITLLETYPSQVAMYSKGIDRIRYLIDSQKAQAFRDVEVILIVGPAGIGKTEGVWKEDPLVYPKPPGNQWFDGYEGQKSILLDDFYGQEFSYCHLLKLLDRYPLQLKVHNGFRHAKYIKVYITSNVLPHDWYRNLFSNKKVNPDALFRRITKLKLYNEVTKQFDDIENPRNYLNQQMQRSLPTLSQTSFQDQNDINMYLEDAMPKDLY